MSFFIITICKLIDSFTYFWIAPVIYCYVFVVFTAPQNLYEVQRVLNNNSDVI